MPAFESDLKVPDVPANKAALTMKVKNGDMYALFYEDYKYYGFISISWVNIVFKDPI